MINPTPYAQRTAAGQETVTAPVAYKVFRPLNSKGVWIEFFVPVHYHSTAAVEAMAMIAAAKLLGGSPEDHFPKYVITRSKATTIGGGE